MEDEKKLSKEEVIIRWMDLAAAVFSAEDAISEEWFPKLRAAKGLPKEERDHVADAYLRAIATEIVEHGYKDGLD